MGGHEETARAENHSLKFSGTMSDIRHRAVLNELHILYYTYYSINTLYKSLPGFTIFLALILDYRRFSTEREGGKAGQ